MYIQALTAQRCQGGKSGTTFQRVPECGCDGGWAFIQVTVNEQANMHPSQD